MSRTISIAKQIQPILTKGATSGTGTAFLSEHMSGGLVFSFLCSVSRSLLALLAIVLFVYRGFMNSD